MLVRSLRWVVCKEPDGESTFRLLTADLRKTLRCETKPEDAWSGIFRASMDALVLANHVLLREDWPELVETEARRAAFTLD